MARHAIAQPSVANDIAAITSVLAATVTFAKDHGIAVCVHSGSYPSRPLGIALVVWVGPAEPTPVASDLWVNTSDPAQTTLHRCEGLDWI